MAVDQDLKIAGKMNFIKNMILSHRIKQATKIAQTLSQADQKKRLILMVAGAPRVFTKKELKIKLQTRMFKKGTTISDLEKLAIVITQ